METGQNKAPSFFSFLREGLLLPSRNWRLFTSVCALILASTKLIELAVHPLAADETKLDIKPLNTTEPGSPDFAKLLQDFLLAGAGYNLFSFVSYSAVRIVVLSAAAFTYPGQDRTITTFGALLSQAKAQIKGPLLTLAFVYVLETLSFVPLAAISSLLGLLQAKQYVVTFLLASLLGFAAVVCLEYFSFLCSFSVVIAVAEPGCYGAAALGKAWRLANGNKRQVVLYLAVTGALPAAVSPLHTLARTNNSVALGLLLGFVYALLLALVQIFSDCAMTAFYYERRDWMPKLSAEERPIAGMEISTCNV